MARHHALFMMPNPRHKARRLFAVVLNADVRGFFAYYNHFETDFAYLTASSKLSYLYV